MAHHWSTDIMDIEANDTVKHEVLGVEDNTHQLIRLPGGVHLFFKGHGDESEANLLGFLDAMHSIRNAVLEDKAQRERCQPSGRHISDGRDWLLCGNPANPAGYCCEHGTYVRPQV